MSVALLLAFSSTRDGCGSCTLRSHTAPSPHFVRPCASFRAVLRLRRYKESVGPLPPIPRAAHLRGGLALPPPSPSPAAQKQPLTRGGRESVGGHLWEGMCKPSGGFQQRGAPGTTCSVARLFSGASFSLPHPSTPLGLVPGIIFQTHRIPCLGSASEGAQTRTAAESLRL